MRGARCELGRCILGGRRRASLARRELRLTLSRRALPSRPLSHPVLSPIETRVLGVLAEKQRTVPDSYPLTLNALVSGCNQKTSRNPLMELSDADVQAAIDSLKGYSLVMESSGGRVARYEHNIERVLRVPSQSTILLTVLMLRGPQTAGELRIACDRMHNFADISSVEAFLDELAERPAGALVVKLARLPGARESRWAQLLSGEPPAQAPVAASRESAAPAETSLGEIAALRLNVSRLEAEVARLKALTARICSELGIPDET
ncbi:MAG: YceH family protein [Gammaproteobacteria bacterium]|nr:YceH family protein [Gammaproteobacteria bacterium]